MLRGIFGLLLFAAIALAGGLIGYQAGGASSAAHGGTIRAESDGVPGHGTTFRVRLPRRS